MAVSLVVEGMKRIGFYDLPRRIMDSKAMCGHVATDHATVALTVFGRDSVKSVEHYLGCIGGLGSDTRLPKLIELQQFYSMIDSVAGVRRWARPPERRKN